jgi:hypothetical protein
MMTVADSSILPCRRTTHTIAIPNRAIATESTASRFTRSKCQGLLLLDVSKVGNAFSAVFALVLFRYG